jgi:hypothetical protein
MTKAPLGLFVAMLGGFKAANQLQLASTLFVPLTSTFRHDEAPFAQLVRVRTTYAFPSCGRASFCRRAFCDPFCRDDVPWCFSFSVE